MKSGRVVGTLLSGGVPFATSLEKVDNLKYTLAKIRIEGSDIPISMATDLYNDLVDQKVQVFGYIRTERLESTKKLFTFIQCTTADNTDEKDMMSLPVGGVSFNVAPDVQLTSKGLPFFTFSVRFKSWDGNKSKVHCSVQGSAAAIAKRAIKNDMKIELEGKLIVQDKRVDYIVDSYKLFGYTLMK